MERYAFLIGKKNERDINWRDTSALVRITERFSSGGFTEYQESKRISIDKKEESVPYRLLLIAEFEQEGQETFVKMIKKNNYKILDSREMKVSEVVQ